jgi:localization factor PodJL
MKSGKTWRVPSLEDEAQDAATEAARQAGLSVNEWMDQAFAQRTTRDSSPRREAAYADAEYSDGGAQEAPAADVGIGAVTDAVEQLNQRIRTLGPTSQSAISGLKGRLDEIEANLGRVADEANREEYRSESLQGVAAMIHRLTRDLDNVDETARSTVEGLRSRPDAAPAAPARDPADQIGIAIQTLDQRIADMADRLKRTQPVAERSQKLDDLRLRLEGLLARNTSSARPAPAMPPIDSTLKALERRIEEATSRMAAPPPPPPTPIEVTAVVSPEQEERMRRIEEHLLNISARMSEPPPPPTPPFAMLSPEEKERARRIEFHLADIAGRLAEPPSQVPTTVALSYEDEERMRQMEARLNEISERLAEPPAPSPTLTQVDNLSAAIVEIAHRQKALDDRADGQAMRREQKAIADSVATLRSDVAGLVARVTAIGRLELEGRDAYAGLAHRLDNLAAEGPVDRGILSGIRGEIDALRAISAGSAREDSVAERIEELARMVPDHGRIDALGEEISAVRRSLETADSPRAIARLEARITDLARDVDAALNSRVAAADASAATLSAGLTH